MLHICSFASYYFNFELAHEYYFYTQLFYFHFIDQNDDQPPAYDDVMKAEMCPEYEEV